MRISEAVLVDELARCIDYRVLWWQGGGTISDEGGDRAGATVMRGETREYRSNSDEGVDRAGATVMRGETRECRSDSDEWRDKRVLE